MCLGLCRCQNSLLRHSPAHIHVLPRQQPVRVWVTPGAIHGTARSTTSVVKGGMQTGYSSATVYCPAAFEKACPIVRCRHATAAVTESGSLRAHLLPMTSCTLAPSLSIPYWIVSWVIVARGRM